MPKWLCICVRAKNKSIENYFYTLSRVHQFFVMKFATH